MTIGGVKMSQLEQDIKAQEDVVSQLDPRTAKHEEEQAKLDALRAELVFQTAQNEVVESFDTLNVPGSDDTIPLAYLLTTDLIPLEDKMTIITSALQNKLANATSVKASLERQIDSMQDRLDNSESENKLLYQGKKELELVINDLETKLHNAGERIEELKEEDGRKESEISKLRDQLSKSAQTTNAKVESVESMAEGLAKRPAIYNVRWESELGRTHKLANLAETDEEIRFHYFNEGIYRVLTDEELLQFRKEKEDREHQAAAEAAKLVEEDLANISLVVPQLPFQEEGHQLDQEDASVGVAGEAVSREEFQALASRVAQLEQSKVAVA
jgi:hypothetical protein